MRAKDWLLANGYISEVTRGRLSRENLDRIHEAVRQGVVIDGYSVSTVQPAEPSAPRAVRRVAADTITDVPDEIRPASSWEPLVNGKPHRFVGMATVCNGCKNSLTYCYCPTPRVWLDHDREGTVSFTTRSKPLSRRKW